MLATPRDTGTVRLHPNMLCIFSLATYDNIFSAESSRGSSRFVRLPNTSVIVVVVVVVLYCVFYFVSSIMSHT